MKPAFAVALGVAGVLAAAALGAPGSGAPGSGTAGTEVPATGTSAAGPVRVEVSYDGLERVELVPPEPAAGRFLGGATDVYPAAPDWSNTLRIQIGGLAVADLDGDGRADVAVGCYQSQSFPPYEDWRNFIYLNTGGELEADPSWTSTDERSTGDVHVALIDGDAFPDLVAGNGGFGFDPSVIYFGGPGGLSTTPGWLSAEPTGAWTSYALPFDWDHDGDLDLVTANQGNSQNDPFRPMYGFFNDSGTLATVPTWQSAESSIQNWLAFGDLDGDGWEDLAVSKWANFETGVYLNDEGALDTVPSWTVGDDDTDRGVAWAEVDGDDDLDLAAGKDPTRLYLNVAGTLTPDWAATGAFFGHQDLAFEDVDLDGDPDLAEIHFSNGHVNLYLNQEGTLDSVPSWSWDAPGVGTALAFGDVDGDGWPDLVVGNAGDPSLFVFYNRLGPEVIFEDSFESGDTTAWSSSIP